MERYRLYDREEGGGAVTDAQDNAIRMVQALLLRLDGVAQSSSTQFDGRDSVLDFRLTFTTVPPLKGTYEYNTGMNNSTVQVDESGGVVNFLLRMPPLPTGTNNYADVYIKVFRMAERVANQFHSHVYIRAGQTSDGTDILVPHVQPALSTVDDVLSPQAITEYVRDLLQLYSQQYEEGV